jgi:SAM-dependent methyltransferase
MPISSTFRSNLVHLSFMQDRPCDKYLKPYREAVKQFGPSFHATLWSSRETQRVRFDVMIDLGGLEDCVIVDAGCGTGDFAEHLITSKVAFERYIGIDAVEEVIEAAHRRHLANCEFRCADLIRDPSPMREIGPDFVCISGTLNTMDEPTARTLVKAAFDAAKQGVLFNFLSNRPGERWAEHNIGPARRFDTMSWIDWALELTPRVSFTQDYLDGHDATIMIRHG